MKKGVAGKHPGYWISLANHFHASWVGNNPGKQQDVWKCKECGTWTYNQWDCCFICGALGGPDDPVDKGEAN